MIQFFKKLLGLGPTEVKTEDKPTEVAVVETAPAEVAEAPASTVEPWPFPTGARPDDAPKAAKPVKAKQKAKPKAPAKAKPAPAKAAKPKQKAKPKAKAKK